jgi:hypothetical protein
VLFTARLKKRLIRRGKSNTYQIHAFRLPLSRESLGKIEKKQYFSSFHFSELSFIEVFLQRLKLDLYDRQFPFNPLQISIINTAILLSSGEKLELLTRPWLPSPVDID